MDSIIEQNDLTEFLSYATLANRDFAAEHENSVTFVVNDAPVIFSVNAETEELQEDDEEFERKRQLAETTSLEIPRRPKWTTETTREELHEMEKQTFLEWRRKLSQFEVDTDATFTPYEKNLHMWRQLWRVVERSDLVVQIVDCRNPLTFRTLDLENYVKETDPDKMNVLLINKSDLLTEKQRFKWAKYFKDKGIKAVFFSAFLEQTKINNTTSSKEELISEQQELIDNFDITNYVDPGEQDITHIYTREELLCWFKSLMKTLVPKLREKAQKRAELLRVAMVKRKQENARKELLKKKKNRRRRQVEDPEAVVEQTPIEIDESDIPSVADLYDDPNNKVVVGMVGYPNVGKSSVINTLCGMKRVAVGATPGKTKHFQTLPIGKFVTLCDCPGLVFPSIRTTKEEMIVDGILPIDQMRDHRSPIAVVCERISRRTFELLYGIDFDNYKNKKITEIQKGLRLAHSKRNTAPLTVDELLEAFAHSRGLMAQKGVPNGPASSRVILKDYVNGKLLFCHPPPDDEDQEHFNDDNAIQVDIEEDDIVLDGDEELSDDEDYFTESDDDDEEDEYDDEEKQFDELDEFLDEEGEVIDYQEMQRQKAARDFNEENIHSSKLENKEELLREKRKKTVRNKSKKKQAELRGPNVDLDYEDLTPEQIEFLEQSKKEADMELTSSALPQQQKVRLEDLTPKQQRRKILLLKNKKSK
jgi:large subunit GTPase 1